MKRCEVDPNDLRFTQDSIAVKFKPPHGSTRIDDGVDKIRSGEWSASTFPSISVVEVDGVLFSLDNRRLWVFRKAKVSSITMKLHNKCLAHPRVQGLEDNPTLTESMKSRGFFPRVRGKNVKQHWPAAVKVHPWQHPQAVPFGWAKDPQLPPQPVRVTYEYPWQERAQPSLNNINYSTDARRLAEIKRKTSVDQNAISAAMEAQRAREIAAEETALQKVWKGILDICSFFIKK